MGDRAPSHTSPRKWEAYRPCTDCEEVSVKLLEIDCAQPLEVPMERGSHYGIVMKAAPTCRCGSAFVPRSSASSWRPSQHRGVYIGLASSGRQVFALRTSCQARWRPLGPTPHSPRLTSPFPGGARQVRSPGSHLLASLMIRQWCLDAGAGRQMLDRPRRSFS